MKSLALGVLGSFASMGVVALTFPSILHFPIPAYLAVLAAMLHKLDTSSKHEAPQQAT
jgi:cytochrome c biogenesis protein CcdA